MAVFKNVMYWADWNAQRIFMADKNRGTGLLTIANQLPMVKDLKVSIYQWRHCFRSHFTMVHFLFVFCRFFRKACVTEPVVAPLVFASSPVCPFLCIGRPNNGPPASVQKACIRNYKLMAVKNAFVLTLKILQGMCRSSGCFCERGCRIDVAPIVER